MNASSAACMEKHIDEMLQEALERGGTFSFRARGMSMRPLIHSGDILVAEQVAPRRLKRGDIVVYRQDSGVYVAHRLLKQYVLNGQRYLVTRGDSMPWPDAPVLVDSFRGRVTAIQREGRRLSLRGFRFHVMNAILVPLSRWCPWYRRQWRRLGRHPWRWLNSFLWKKETR